MEIRSDPGIMLGRDSFSAPLQQNHVSAQSSMSNMRIAFASDGTTIYKPVNATPPHYQAAPGAGSGGAEEAVPQPISQHGMNMNVVGEPVKRKRGRPRKYGPDGAGSPGLSNVKPSTAANLSAGMSSPQTGMNQASLPTSSGKKRGRPLGSVNKTQAAAAGSAGIGFTPHVLTIQAGEDVSSKIMSFTQCGPRAVCILSANGAISNVTLYQAATSGGTVTYEGRFEILSLSGSFLLSDSGVHRSRTGGLSISMAGSDGRVLGGGVAGLLVAASPVQVILGSFIADGRKESKHKSPSEATYGTKNPPGSEMGLASPPSHGALSESSGGPGSSA